MTASRFDALASELRKRLCAKIMNDCICWHFELFSSPNPQDKQCKRHNFVCIVSHLQTQLSHGNWCEIFATPY